MPIKPSIKYSPANKMYEPNYFENCHPPDKTDAFYDSRSMHDSQSAADSYKWTHLWCKRWRSNKMKSHNAISKLLQFEEFAILNLRAILVWKWYHFLNWMTKCLQWIDGKNASSHEQSYFQTNNHFWILRVVAVVKLLKNIINSYSAIVKRESGKTKRFQNPWKIIESFRCE